MLTRDAVVAPALTTYAALRATVTTQLALLNVSTAPLLLAQTVIAEISQAVDQASQILPLAAFNQTACGPLADFTVALSRLADLGTVSAALNSKLSELAAYLAIGDYLQAVIDEIDTIISGLNTLFQALTEGNCQFAIPE